MTVIRELFETENIFFTSDTHFGHFNVISHCDRPFTDKVTMDYNLIDNWNSVVGEDDIVFHLGDFALEGPKRTHEILNQLKGRIHLVKGNHEKSVLKKEYTRDRFESISDILEIRVMDDELDYENADIIMCHYPMLSWRGSNHGSIHLFGHVHGTLIHPSPKAIDVGVDNHGYTPLSYNDIKKVITKGVMNYE